MEKSQATPARAGEVKVREEARGRPPGRAPPVSPGLAPVIPPATTRRQAGPGPWTYFFSMS